MHATMLRSKIILTCSLLTSLLVLGESSTNLNLQLVFSKAAQLDYYDVVLYYQDISEKLVVGFDKDLQLILDYIRSEQLLFRAIEERPYRKANLIHFPYSVVYVVEEDFILILALVHQGQHPDRLKRRLP